MSTLIFIFLKLISLSESARILGIFPNFGYSQYILGSTLMKELAVKGHEVTIISPFSENVAIPNYSEIVTKLEIDAAEMGNLYDLESANMFSYVKELYDTLGLFITEGTLKDDQVQRILHSNTTFDLVISEIFANEAHMGFAHHFKAPLILFCSMGAIEWANHLMGNPAPLSHLPITFSGYTDHMTFWERLRNSAMGLLDAVYKHLFIFPKQNGLLQKYFPNAPDLKDLMYNASLMLLNSHPAMNTPVAHVPNMVEIGGFHVSPKKLPLELQEFLDSAHDGAIFFSMGSNLNSSDLSREKSNAILRVFSKLKQKVLWKWEEPNLPGKPDNVKIGKWMPQPDILAHPNVRAFITHSGLLSTTEAVYCGVPIVAIPVFGDQKMNAATAVSNGIAVELSLNDITEEKLSWAINEVLTNTSYRKAVQRRSKILKDQPMKPLDTAMFWIEYVLRHKGATHLRSAALNLYWYQYMLLDVLAFIVFTIISALVLSKIVLYRILKKNRRKIKTK